jgi:hypothetical protein
VSCTTKGGEHDLRPVSIGWARRAVVHQQDGELFDEDDLRRLALEPCDVTALRVRRGQAGREPLERDVEPGGREIRLDDLGEPLLLLGGRVGPARPCDLEVVDPDLAGVAIGVDGGGHPHRAEDRLERPGRFERDGAPRGELVPDELLRLRL